MRAEMARKPLSFSALAGAWLAAVALWVSAGTLTVATPEPGARLGLLPSPGWLAIAAFAALVVTLVARPTTRTAAVLSVSALCLLPWLPTPVPAAALIWTGHLSLWLWIALALTIVAPWLARGAAAIEAVRDPRRAPRLAAAITAALALVAAWQVFPRLPGGDEPHYLIITQSLLTDHDLKIENNHRRGDYRAYYRGDLAKPDYLRRGVDGQIYSIHAPGLAALIAPVFALAGYPGVIVVLALFGAFGAALAWTAAWRVTQDIAAAWFGWAAVALSVPFFFQTFVVFPDGPAAAIVMLGVLTALAGAEASERRLAGTGLALAILPWLHTRFALLAGAIGLVLLLRQRESPQFVRRAVRLLALPAISAVLWFGFFWSIYGTPSPSAPYGGYTQSSAANLPRGITGLLFDQQFGLAPNAPVLVCAALGFIPLLRTRRRLGLELLLVIVPYSLAVAAYQMWWAGYSSPARFIVPVILTLSIPAAAWYAAAGRASRICAMCALGFSVFITIALFAVDHGALLYNTREGAAARWLLWLSPLVNLTTGVPSLFQNTPAVVAEQALVWIGAIAAAAWIAGAAGRRAISDKSVAAVVYGASALGAMVALTIVWRTNLTQPVTASSGSMALLRAYDPARGQLGVRYAPLERAAPDDLLSMMTLADVQPAPLPANQPPALLAHPPAGTYEVAAILSTTGAGRVTATVDREFGPQWTWDLTAGTSPWRATIALPVGVAGLRLDADPAARRVIDRLTVRASSVQGGPARLTDAEPVHATRLSGGVLFLLDGHAYTERAGTWVAGGDSATFVVAPDAAGPAHLFVRNFAAANHVTLSSGAWHQDLTLAPREERQLDCPVDAERKAARLQVTSSAGARPSQVEPGNADTRLLGCWVEIR